MKCKDASSLFSDYIDSKISVESGARLEAHLAECDICKCDFERTKSVVEKLHSLHPSPALTIDLCPLIQNAIGEIQLRTFHWSVIFTRPAIAGPTFAVILILLSFVFGPSGFRFPSEGTSVTSPEYTQYLGAHLNVQRQQPLNDPDAAFVATQLETSRISSVSEVSK